MDVTMMLCDWAEAVNGKLYIMGAGWTHVPANAPVPVAVAVLVTVPWDLTNREHTLRLELMDEDGHRVSIGEPPQDVLQEGKFEAGRPAGVRAGTGLPLPLSFRWQMLPLPVGGYTFVVSIDQTEEVRVSFRTQEAL